MCANRKASEVAITRVCTKFPPYTTRLMWRVWHICKPRATAKAIAASQATVFAATGPCKICIADKLNATHHRQAAPTVECTACARSCVYVYMFIIVEIYEACGSRASARAFRAVSPPPFAHNNSHEPEIHSLTNTHTHSGLVLCLAGTHNHNTIEWRRPRAYSVFPLSFYSVICSTPLIYFFRGGCSALHYYVPHGWSRVRLCASAGDDARALLPPHVLRGIYVVCVASAHATTQCAESLIQSAHACTLEQLRRQCDGTCTQIHSHTHSAVCCV